MMDNRRAQRHLTLRTGKILAEDGQGTVDCAVLNISKTGACILVPAGATIPEGFDLAIDCEDTIRNCKMVWCDGPRIGLRFECSDTSG
jgi:invasion protein IalB